MIRFPDQQAQLEIEGNPIKELAQLSHQTSRGLSPEYSRAERGLLSGKFSEHDVLNPTKTETYQQQQQMVEEAQHALEGFLRLPESPTSQTITNPIDRSPSYMKDFELQQLEIMTNIHNQTLRAQQQRRKSKGQGSQKEFELKVSATRRTISAYRAKMQNKPKVRANFEQDTANIMVQGQAFTIQTSGKSSMGDAQQLRTPNRSNPRKVTGIQKIQKRSPQKQAEDENINENDEDRDQSALQNQISQNQVLQTEVPELQGNSQNLERPKSNTMKRPTLAENGRKSSKIRVDIDLHRNEEKIQIHPFNQMDQMGSHSLSGTQIGGQKFIHSNSWSPSGRGSKKIIENIKSLQMLNKQLSQPNIENLENEAMKKWSYFSNSNKKPTLYEQIQNENQIADALTKAAFQAQTQKLLRYSKQFPLLESSATVSEVEAMQQESLNQQITSQMLILQKNNSQQTYAVRLQGNAQNQHIAPSANSKKRNLKMSKTSDLSDVTLKRKRNARSKRGSSARRGDNNVSREEILDKTSSSNIEEGDSPQGYLSHFKQGQTPQKLQDGPFNVRQSDTVKTEYLMQHAQRAMAQQSTDEFQNNRHHDTIRKTTELTQQTSEEDVPSGDKQIRIETENERGSKLVGQMSTFGCQANERELDQLMETVAEDKNDTIERSTISPRRKQQQEERKSSKRELSPKMTEDKLNEQFKLLSTSIKNTPFSGLGKIEMLDAKDPEVIQKFQKFDKMCQKAQYRAEKYLKYCLIAKANQWQKDEHFVLDRDVTGDKKEVIPTFLQMKKQNELDYQVEQVKKQMRRNQKREQKQSPVKQKRKNAIQNPKTPHSIPQANLNDHDNDQQMVTTKSEEKLNTSADPFLEIHEQDIQTPSMQQTEKTKKMDINPSEGYGPDGIQSQMRFNRNDSAVNTRYEQIQSKQLVFEGQTKQGSERRSLPEATSGQLLKIQQINSTNSREGSQIDKVEEISPRQKTRFHMPKNSSIQSQDEYLNPVIDRMQVLGSNVKISNKGEHVVIPSPPGNGVIDIFAHQLHQVHGRSQGQQNDTYTRNVVPIYNIQMSKMHSNQRNTEQHGRPLVTSVVSSGRSQGVRSVSSDVMISQLRNERLALVKTFANLAQGPLSLSLDRRRQSQSTQKFQAILRETYVKPNSYNQVRKQQLSYQQKLLRFGQIEQDLKQTQNIIATRFYKDRNAQLNRDEMFDQLLAENLRTSAYLRQKLGGATSGAEIFEEMVSQMNLRRLDIHVERQRGRYLCHMRPEYTQKLLFKSGRQREKSFDSFVLHKRKLHGTSKNWSLKRSLNKQQPTSRSQQKFQLSGRAIDMSLRNQPASSRRNEFQTLSFDNSKYNFDPILLIQQLQSMDKLMLESHHSMSNINIDTIKNQITKKGSSQKPEMHQQSIGGKSPPARIVERGSQRSSLQNSTGNQKNNTNNFDLINEILPHDVTQDALQNQTYSQEQAQGQLKESVKDHPFLNAFLTDKESDKVDSRMAGSPNVNTVGFNNLKVNQPSTSSYEKFSQMSPSPTQKRIGMQRLNLSSEQTPFGPDHKGDQIDCSQVTMFNGLRQGTLMNNRHNEPSASKLSYSKKDILNGTFNETKHSNLQQNYVKQIEINQNQEDKVSPQYTVVVDVGRDFKAQQELKDFVGKKKQSQRRKRNTQRLASTRLHTGNAHKAKQTNEITKEKGGIFEYDFKQKNKIKKIPKELSKVGLESIAALDGKQLEKQLNSLKQDFKITSGSRPKTTRQPYKLGPKDSTEPLKNQIVQQQLFQKEHKKHPIEKLKQKQNIENTIYNQDLNEVEEDKPRATRPPSVVLKTTQNSRIQMQKTLNMKRNATSKACGSEFNRHGSNLMVDIHSQLKQEITQGDMLKQKAKLFDHMDKTNKQSNKDMRQLTTMMSSTVKAPSHLGYGYFSTRNSEVIHRKPVGALAIRVSSGNASNFSHQSTDGGVVMNRSIQQKEQNQSVDTDLRTYLKRKEMQKEQMMSMQNQELFGGYIDKSLGISRRQRNLNWQSHVQRSLQVDDTIPDKPFLGVKSYKQDGKQQFQESTTLAQNQIKKGNIKMGGLTARESFLRRTADFKYHSKQGQHHKSYSRAIMSLQQPERQSDGDMVVIPNLYSAHEQTSGIMTHEFSENALEVATSDRKPIHPHEHQMTKAQWAKFLQKEREFGRNSDQNQVQSDTYRSMRASTKNLGAEGTMQNMITDNMVVSSEGIVINQDLADVRKINSALSGKTLKAANNQGDGTEFGSKRSSKQFLQERSARLSTNQNEKQQFPLHALMSPFSTAEGGNRNFIIDQLILSDDTLPLPDKGHTTNRGREQDYQGANAQNQQKKTLTSIPLKGYLQKQDTAQTLGSPISPELVRMHHQFSIEKSAVDGLSPKEAIHLPQATFQLHIQRMEKE